MKKRKAQHHGKTNTRIYKIYCCMKTRCYNLNAQHYKRYGKLGIKICEEWLNDFMSFYNWSMTHGYNDKLTIDRIDNTKGYSPENCRWITLKKQCNNRSTNHLIEINGVTKTLQEWSEETGIDRCTILRNLAKGYTGQKILTPERFRITKSKIAQYDLNGNLIKVWNSLIEIGKTLNLKSRYAISSVCKHKVGYKTAFGYKWEYYKD